MGIDLLGGGVRRHSLVITLSAMTIGVVLASLSTPARGQTPVPAVDIQLGPATMSYAGDDGLWGPLDGFLRGSSEPKNKNKDKDGNRKDRGEYTKEECWTWDESELRFFEKLNDARRRHGVPTVDLDPELSKVAQHHSYNMKVEQRLYHTPESKLRERVTNWQIMGENVGRGLEVDSLHRAFMDSKDHRYIALYKDFNYVGIGVSHDKGQMWVTILLEAYENPGTTMEMPASC